MVWCSCDSPGRKELFLSAVVVEEEERKEDRAVSSFSFAYLTSNSKRRTGQDRTGQETLHISSAWGGGLPLLWYVHFPSFHVAPFSWTPARPIYWPLAPPFSSFLSLSFYYYKVYSFFVFFFDLFFFYTICFFFYIHLNFETSSPLYFSHDITTL